jgi:hypothetical protein
LSVSKKCDWVDYLFFKLIGIFDNCRGVSLIKHGFSPSPF